MKEIDYTPLVVKSPLNETNEVVNCLHPKIILHPLFQEYVYRFGNYTYLGRTTILNPGYRRTFYSYFHKIYFKPGEMSIDDMKDCYVTDFKSGEVYPMYLATPCGHCDVCKKQKLDNFAHRCELETQVYNHYPYFLTLTYRDSELPDGGLDVRDAQLFLKRFRSRLAYAGFNDHFRYVCVGEYGHNTHREHLHLLLWNLYPSGDIKFSDIRRIVHQSWSKGWTFLSVVSPNYFVKGRFHGFAKPTNCFKYVSKYIAKDCVVPPGKRQTFFCTSRRNGGIGAPFIDRHIPYLRSKLHHKFMFLDKFSQEVKPLIFNRYVLNRVFPTLYSSIPSELRKAVVRLCNSAPFVKDYFGHSSYMTSLRKSFPDVFWPFMRIEDFSGSIRDSMKAWLDCPSARSLYMHNIWEDIKLLDLYKDFDFKSAILLAEKRTLFCSKLYESRRIRYLLPIAKSFRFYKDLQSQKEVF